MTPASGGTLAPDAPASTTWDACQLVLRERQCRDRGWFAEMAACYFADSQVRLTWFRGDGPAFCAASREMAAAGRRNHHRMGAPVARQHGVRLLVEAPAEIVFPVAEPAGASLVCWTRLVYRLEERDGVLGIVALDVVYERDAISPAVDRPTDAFPRSSYAWTARHLAANGYEVDPDLLGDDRPDAVAAFYDAALAWLHGGEVSC